MYLTAEQYNYFVTEMRICANLLITSNPTERLRLLAKITHYTNILLADAAVICDCIGYNLFLFYSEC